MSRTPAPASRTGEPGTPRLRRRIAGVLAAAVVVTWGGPAAYGYWQTVGANAASVKADSIPAIAAPSAAASAGTATVSWSSGATAAGRPVTGYTVARYSAASGGTNVAAGGNCAGILTALSCTESSLPGGTWYYTVTPVLAAWQGPESGRSAGIVGDSVPPDAPTFVSPVTVNASEAANVTVRGTAEAGSSVTVTATDAGIPQQSLPQTSLPQTVTPAPSGEWSTTFNLTSFADGTITYSAVATDASGNTSVPGTASSLKDATAPVARVILVNGTDANKNNEGFAEAGDKVVITYSEPIKASTICSSWTSDSETDADSQDYLINGKDEVILQISTANVLTVSAAAKCPVLNIGPVSLGGDYTGTTPLTFSGSGANVSSIAWSASTKTLTLTLGRMTAGTPPTEAAVAGTPAVTQPGVTDLAGNQAVSTSPLAPSRF